MARLWAKPQGGASLREAKHQGLRVLKTSMLLLSITLIVAFVVTTALIIYESYENSRGL